MRTLREAAAFEQRGKEPIWLSAAQGLMVASLLPNAMEGATRNMHSRRWALLHPRCPKRNSPTAFGGPKLVLDRCPATSARRQQWTTRTQPGRFSTSSASAFHRSAVFSSTRLLCGSFVFAANSAHSDALARYSSVNVGMAAQVLSERRDHGASLSIASGSP